MAGSVINFVIIVQQSDLYRYCIEIHVHMCVHVHLHTLELNLDSFSTMLSTAILEGAHARTF